MERSFVSATISKSCPDSSVRDHRAVVPVQRESHLVSERAQWNDRVQQLGGDILQSWQWGAFKQGHGWDAERLRITSPDGEGMAQILFRRRGPVTLAYLPRGPMIERGPETASRMLAAIDQACISRGTAILIVEPDRPLPESWTNDETKFVTGPKSFQTSRTVKVHLVDDQSLLAQMRKDTRYNVGFAQRKGVVVDRIEPGSSAMASFYRLLTESAERSRFGIHDQAYYTNFLDRFHDEAALFFASADGIVTAAMIVVRWGRTGRSMYAGSSVGERVRGDAALLRFEAMRWARDHGCSHFDLGGIAPEPYHSAGAEVGTSTLQGVHQFKVGFGGEIISYPATMERRYRPLQAWCIRRFNTRFQSSPR